MYIRRIDISNFRGIAKGTFHLSPQCVIIGPNGCGKSTLVDAIALALGRGRIVKALTEHDFTGSNPGPEDRFRIVVSLCGFRDNDHSRNTDWFREGRAIPKWIDSAGTVHASSGPDRVLAAQIAVVGHFDHEELTVEMKRYFYDADDADADDPFLSDSHIEEVPAQLFNQAGLFVLLARRTWEGVVSFNSDLFRRTLLEAAGFPSAEVIHQRDALREPEKPIEASSALGKLVSSINERLGKLLPSAPGLRLRLTAGDSDSVLHALQPHYASESACLPVSRHGVGLLSLQSFLLLLEVATSRKSKNKSVVLALEEPELHLAPGLSTRLVAESRSTADQVICTTSEALEEGSFAQSKRGKRTNTQTRNELAQSAIYDVPAWSEVSNDICESIMTNSDFTVFKFWRRTAAQAILAITLTGCDDLVVAPALASTCKVFGICDEPPLPAEMIDVLCDSSIGSSCTRETLDKTLPRTLQYAVKRPGTRMRLWLLGKSVADTTVAGERESATMPAHTSQRARKAFDEKFAANGEEHFMAAGVLPMMSARSCQ
ncbi:MAG: AAA family ATPase [Patescibacteria group bacterium]